MISEPSSDLVDRQGRTKFRDGAEILSFVGKGDACCKCASTRDLSNSTALVGEEFDVLTNCFRCLRPIPHAHRVIVEGLRVARLI